MKTFACGEVVPDCPAVFSGPDFEAVLSQIAEHARTVHQLPELSPDIVDVVRRAWQQSEDHEHGGG